MIRFIAGGKGEGKTKKLIDMVNESVKHTDGHLVFIDSTKKHIYDLHYDIRFVDTEAFPLSNYREFVGFTCGILSQDNDIKEIYVDNINHIVKTLDSEGLTKLVDKLTKLSASNSVDFIISINSQKDELPEEVKKLII